MSKKTNNNNNAIISINPDRNTVFWQQRARGCVPIFGSLTFLMATSILAITMVCVGYWLMTLSLAETEIEIDYTTCRREGGTYSNKQSPMTDVGLDKFRNRLFRSSPFSWGGKSPSTAHRDANADNNIHVMWKHLSEINENPKYKSTEARKEAPPSYFESQNIGGGNCTINFRLPRTLRRPVRLYYQLTNMHQNHRRLVNSFSPQQLVGTANLSLDLLEKQCSREFARVPFSENKKLVYYPCGRLANAYFDDEFSNLTRIQSLNKSGTSISEYTFSQEDIAWPTDSQRYRRPSDFNPETHVPPPRWQRRYGRRYTEFPQRVLEPRFWVWMRPAPFATFRKLYGVNRDEDLGAGYYSLTIDDNYNVESFDGRKAVVIAGGAGEIVDIYGGSGAARGQTQTQTQALRFWQRLRLGTGSIVLGLLYLKVGILQLSLAIAFVSRRVLLPQRINHFNYGESG